MTQSTSSKDPQSSEESSQSSSGISIIDLFIIVGEMRIFFFAATATGIAITILACILIPKYYSASTIILPPQQQQSATVNALAQLGALGIAGAGSNLKTPEEMYVSLLKSNSVIDDMIAKLKLKEKYETSGIESTRNILKANSTIVADKKSGFLIITVDDRDAKLAADIANGYVDSLRKLLSRLALTDAQQRRTFFEQQVVKTKNSLIEAEISFRKAQSESGLVVTQALAETGVKESSLLRSQIASREVQLQALSHTATPEHPEYQRIIAELGALRGQLSKIEDGTGQSDKKLSKGGAVAVQAFRDMKIQEALLENLIKQVELARADELKEGPLLQQIDPAYPPEKKNKPRTTVLALIGGIASLIFGLIITITFSLINKNPTQLTRIRAAWFS